jgi:hypothetical protein
MTRAILPAQAVTSCPTVEAPVHGAYVGRPVRKVAATISGRLKEIA